jgi:hypothetical protein
MPPTKTKAKGSKAADPSKKSKASKVSKDNNTEKDKEKPDADGKPIPPKAGDDIDGADADEADASSVGESDVRSSDDECCDRDFGRVRSGLIRSVTRRGRCLRCGWRVSDHQISEIPDISPASPAAGGGVQVVLASRSDVEKKLQRFREAQDWLRTPRSGYRHVWAARVLPDLERSLRHADACHLGMVGCPSLVTGDLPERPTREGQTTPWGLRSQLVAMAVDATVSSIVNALSLAPEDADHISRQDVWLDAPVNAPGWTIGETWEVVRGLQHLAMGLRVAAIRDPVVFARHYAASTIRMIHPVVGPLNWFVYQRTVGLDRLRCWLIALRDGTVLPSYEVEGEATAVSLSTASPPSSPSTSTSASSSGAARTAASVCVVDLEVWGRVWPWIGLGAAACSGMGSASRAIAAGAWDALDAAEALVVQALKVVQPEPTKGGPGDTVSPPGSPSKRAEKRRRSLALATAGAGAGGGGGGGGVGGGRGGGRGAKWPKGAAAATAAATAALVVAPTATAGAPGAGTPVNRMAARTRVMAKQPNEITRSDCLDAALCFTCKQARHDATVACTLRGVVVA